MHCIDWELLSPVNLPLVILDQVFFCFYVCEHELNITVDKSKLLLHTRVSMHRRTSAALKRTHGIRCRSVHQDLTSASTVDLLRPVLVRCVCCDL